MSKSVSKLDSVGVRLQGDPFSLWAGPVSVALGADARWEEQSESIGELDTAGVFGTPTFNDPLEGGFTDTAAFEQELVPLVQTAGIDVEANGAPRYFYKT